jgi:hypothetical protein
MEFEHQHERRLPNTDPDSDGVANCDSGHTDTYPNSHSESDGDGISNTSHTDPNGHGISDAYTSDTYTNSDANSWPNLHGDLRQLGADHHCGHAAGYSLPIEHHGGGCE